MYVRGRGVEGMLVLCAAVFVVFINALCVHQCSVCASTLCVCINVWCCVCALLCGALVAMCTHREVATRLTWTGPSCMGTWTPTVPTSRCVCMCVFVLPLFTQAALFVIAESREIMESHPFVARFVTCCTCQSCCFRWMMCGVWCGQSTRIRVGRNIRGFALSPGISREVSACSGFTDASGCAAIEEG